MYIQINLSNADMWPILAWLALHHFEKIAIQLTLSAGFYAYHLCVTVVKPRCASLFTKEIR